MNYLLRSSNYAERRKNAQKKILLSIIVIVIIGLIALATPIRNSLFFIAKPIWGFQNLIANSSLGEYFKTKGVLIEKNRELENRLFMLGNSAAMSDITKNENDTLKDLLGRKDSSLNTILAVVLVKPPQIAYDSIIIDIGDDHGVMVGDKVIANANVYIGEVSEVYPHTSKVVLYSSPDRKLSVMLGNNSVNVESVGVGGGNFNIFLPREVEVKENDVIVVPSITPNVFGIVEKVNFKDKDSFQTVLFKSPVNISELKFVEVITQKIKND